MSHPSDVQGEGYGRAQAYLGGYATGPSPYPALATPMLLPYGISGV